MIGIFDSGVGGLSVLREIRDQYPTEDLLYLADQQHVPYGSRSKAQVRDFSEAITRFLINQGANVIVVACNTASAAALRYLRDSFPEMPFVGMEPAVKPAAERTRSGVVGVLATPATFQGELYASVVERFAQGVTVLQNTCDGLVPLIEKGELETPTTRAILESALHPMLGCNIDRVVIGCTHYPFVIPLIKEIVSPGVEVIDPAPAVARQVGRVLGMQGLQKTGSGLGAIQYLTTGDPAKLRALLPRLIGAEADQVQQIFWQDGEINQESTSPDVE